MGRGAPVFCFGFAALVVGRLSADRGEGRNSFVLPVCGVGGEFFCADRDEVRHNVLHRKRRNSKIYPKPRPSSLYCERIHHKCRNSKTSPQPRPSSLSCKRIHIECRNSKTSPQPRLSSLSCECVHIECRKTKTSLKRCPSSLSCKRIHITCRKSKTCLMPCPKKNNVNSHRKKKHFCDFGRIKG